MLPISVSNLELFRVWKSDEDLDLGWLLARLRKEVEQTEAMKVGEAFHKGLELTAEAGDYAYLMPVNGYQFDFQCDAEIELPRFKELSVSQQYGDVLVRGRVDAISGKTVIDHKTTAQFDADRLMSGYQWRYYLDMTGAYLFRWNVFVLKETDDPKQYIVSDFHQLEQRRYPELHDDCLKLARDFGEFAQEHLQ